MAVTRLERKARRNKARAKERTLLIKRNVKRILVKSAHKDVSGIILEEDVMTLAAQIESAAKAAPAPKKATKVVEAKEEEPAVESPAKTQAATQPKAEKAPKAKKAPAADKLNKIEGIGPKIAGVLNAAGITSFALLAQSTPEAIKEILDNAEGKFAAHDPETWPKQSEMAAAGNWDELKTWQEELKGGK
jgi:predicted flap endonuclease-1-like 5' DNA nuclease